MQRTLVRPVVRRQKDDGGRYLELGKARMGRESRDVRRLGGGYGGRMSVKEDARAKSCAVDGEDKGTKRWC